MRESLSNIILHLLLAASVLTVMPMELMVDALDGTISCYESEKEEKEEKANKNKIHYTSESIALPLPAKVNPTSSFQYHWEAPTLSVTYPPPEMELV